MIDIIQTVLSGSSILGVPAALVLAFIAGIATSLTPCIFPMIPITLSIVTSVGDRQKMSWLNLLWYGTGLSLAYVMLGALSVLSGQLFGSILQNLWVKIFVGNIFLLIAFNTFGWIRLPQLNLQGKKIESRLSLLSLGIVTGLTLSPCTLPVLAIVLAYASTTSLMIGMLLLWAYAWGFFMILLLIGIFGNRFKNTLPKSGQWLNRVETALGLLCLGIGEYFIFQAGYF